MAHEFGYANEVDFLHQIQLVIDDQNIVVNGQPLVANDLFLPFFRQPLYPLISVDLVGDKLKIQQGDRPFLHNPESVLSDAEFGYKYSVILRWTHTANEQILPMNDMVEITAVNEPIKLNKGQS